ncbi:MAG: hypothetical protein WC557_12105 [Ignavibacteriaceae bacterium]
MNIEAQKSELIKWIKNLQDSTIIEEVSKLRNKKFEKKLQKRKFGCGKGIFSFVSDNFDQTPKEFSEYCK